MQLTFRWYGDNDRIPLKHIRQIPGIKGVVSALYDIPVGEPWPLSRIKALKQKVEDYELELSVIESVPVHEDIKLGRETRDQYIEAFNQTLSHLSQAGIRTVCYNFMPAFDWTRSNLDYELEDGSLTLNYDNQEIEETDPLAGELELPGWDTSYDNTELKNLLEEYRKLSEEELWDNLEYFLKKVVPVASRKGIKLAIHPDDPPWPIFGLPRIIRDYTSLNRLLNIVDNPANGIALCTGSLGADPDNNLTDMIRDFGSRNRINFVHARNIERTGDRSFNEVSHYTRAGSLDLLSILKVLKEVDYQGPLRPDHGRMIWGEQGKPGYGLYDRALGATYINGIWETLTRYHCQ